MHFFPRHSASNINGASFLKPVSESHRAEGRTLPSCFPLLLCALCSLRPLRTSPAGPNSAGRMAWLGRHKASKGRCSFGTSESNPGCYRCREKAWEGNLGPSQWSHFSIWDEEIEVPSQFPAWILLESPGHRGGRLLPWPRRPGARQQDSGAGPAGRTGSARCRPAAAGPQAAWPPGG